MKFWSHLHIFRQPDLMLSPDDSLLEDNGEIIAQISDQLVRRNLFEHLRVGDVKLAVP